MTNPARIQPVFLVLIILAAAFAWTAGATTNRPPAPPTTVATLDIVQVFDELEERTVLESQLSTRVQARQAQLDEIAQRIQAIRADLDPDTGTLIPGTEAYKERVRELMEQQAVAEARRNALTQIISIDQGSVRASLYAKIQEAVDKVAERDSIDLVILDDSLFPVPEGASDNDVYRAIITKSVIYKHDSIDITDRVITLLNSEYSAP